MAKKYDPTVKDLAAAYPLDWCHCLDPAGVGGDEAEKLCVASGIMASMRHPADLVKRLYEGAKVNIEDASLYTWIHNKGQVDYAREAILRLGRRLFGEPAEAHAAAVSGVADLDRLDRMIDRATEAKG